MKNSVAALLGHNRRPTRRSNQRKRSFKRKVKSYLKADYFLYAPLLSYRRPLDFSPSLTKTLDSSAPGLRRNETSTTGQQKKKKLVHGILEYLQSDSHMYAALIDSPKKAAPACSGLVHRLEKLTIAISRRIKASKHKCSDNPTPDHHVVKEDSNNVVSEGEAVRQISRRNRMSSNSGGAMNRELRRLVT